MEENINLLEQSLRNLDLGVESKQECFPRSEYCVRFKGTSAFDMSNPNFWGTYFRSTAPGGNSDRLTKLSESKFYENSIINKEKSAVAKTGAFSSPWVNEPYSRIFFSPPEITRNSIKLQEDHGFLYDSSLSYKNMIAKKICFKIDDLFSNANDKKMIDVYHCNDFPCVMVTVPRFNEACGNCEAGSLYRIACAYFTALCNHTAVQNGIPIEMVLRSSFGHNSPSVTETSNSFRINIGIVPNEYCGVISESLFLLNNLFLLPLIQEELTLDITSEDIKRHNRDVAFYNNEKNKKDMSSDVKSWEVGEPLFRVLFKVGDSKNRKVSYQITRLNKYVDLLTHFVSDELSIPTDLKNLSRPISKLLNYLLYEVIQRSRSKIASAHVVVPEIIYRWKLREFKDRTISAITDDEEFWNILSKLVRSINGNDDLLETIRLRRLNGLYSKLEQANLNFIRKSKFVLSKVDGGHGSDSEGEMDIESPNRTKLRLYTKKVIVSTGMRAINIAQHLSDYRIKQQNLNIVTDTKYMYYETRKALLSSPKLFDFFITNKCNRNATVKYIDLNYCSSSGRNELNLDKIDVLSVEVIVLDYTSAQTCKIRQAVELFSSKVPLIILINSGLKHEQMGADMNPYGTVRIITRDYTLLNELYFVAITAIASEGLPKNFHHIRKAYKRIGAVVRNKNIYSHNFHPNFRRKTFEEQKLMSTISSSDFINIIHCMNNVNYRAKVCKLFHAQLFNVFITFFSEDALDELLDSAFDICNLAESNLISDQINCLSFKDIKKLLYLLSTCPDDIYKFVHKYNQDLETIVSWSDDTIETLSSAEVESIIDEELVDFDDIVACYEINSDIVHSILVFYNDCDTPHLLFLEKDFQHIFLILKEERSRAEEWPYLSDSDILQNIHERNFNNWIPDGFSSSSSD